MSHSRIVTGYDGSTDAEAALSWSAETARVEGRALEVVIVAALTDGVHRHREDPAEPVEAWRASALSRLVAMDVVESSVEVRQGPIVPSLLDESVGAGMLVVGSTGHGLASGTLTGSVSQHVARHASCPVIVARPPRSPHARRIVVGIDGSAESAEALRFACERARTSGEPVIAVHGYGPLSNRSVALDETTTGKATRAIATAEQLVHDVCAKIAAEYADVAIEPVAIATRPAQVLVNASAGASLVVVGSRGRDAFTELLLGSVGQHVLHHAECPVAIIR